MSSCNISKKVLITIFQRASHEVILQILKVIPARTEMNVMITNKRQFKLVICVCKQQLSVLCQSIDEVAEGIQVQNHGLFEHAIGSNAIQ